LKGTTTSATPLSPENMPLLLSIPILLFDLALTLAVSQALSPETLLVSIPYSETELTVTWVIAQALTITRYATYSVFYRLGVIALLAAYKNINRLIIHVR
jgi:hypothetical protein